VKTHEHFSTTCLRFDDRLYKSPGCLILMVCGPCKTMKFTLEIVYTPHIEKWIVDKMGCLCSITTIGRDAINRVSTNSGNAATNCIHNEIPIENLFWNSRGCRSKLLQRPWPFFPLDILLLADG